MVAHSWDDHTTTSDFRFIHALCHKEPRIGQYARSSARQLIIKSKSATFRQLRTIIQADMEGLGSERQLFFRLTLATAIYDANSAG